MLKAYHVFTAYPSYDNWGVLVYAESANKARSLATGFYEVLVGGDRNDEYFHMRARRLPHMDGRWHQDPIAMDGSENIDAKALVEESGIYECPTCGSTDCDWRCDE